MKVTLNYILPKELNIAAMRAKFLASVQDTANGVYKDFRKTVVTWDTKVDFSKSVKQTANDITMSVLTDNRIYKIVSDGADAHTYSVRRPGGFMRFKQNYKAKTRVGVIGSRTGGKYGAMRGAKTVNHPGVEARKFPETIAAKWQPIMQNLAQKAMNDAAQASGHRI